MKRSLCLARRLPSCVCWNSRDVIPSSSAICSVSATGNLPIPNFKRRLSGERLRVQHENSEKRCLPLGTRVTAEENRNALLSNASSLAADERREQIFISDTEHHRIIVVNQAGNILDCIGSSPGFEDGTFENAMLCCPSSTVYDELNDCLYIADSKNNVIRRADLSKRTVDTVGRNMDDSESPLWSRILKWMRGFGFVSNKKPQQQTEEITDGARNKTTLSNPWHLNLAVNGSLIVASRGFESSWVLDPITGESSKISCEGSEAVHEDYEKKLFASKEKADTFNFIRKSSLTESTLRPYSSTDMVSLVAKIHQNLFFLETEGHVVRKMDLQTGSTTTLKLSNFGCLGFPSWWFIQPLSLLTADRDNVSTAPSTSQEDNILCHEIQLQPGRCLVCIDPVLPEGMALAAPVDDKSVLRQARGSVVDLSMFGGRLVSHKISGAQQWVDDFEDLEAEDESFDELVGPLKSEYGLPLYTFIDASLGSGEVQVDAVLYLKPSGSGSTKVVSRTDPIKTSSTETHTMHSFDAADNDDYVCLRHLHVRVRIEVTTTASSERTNLISVQV